MNRVAKMSVICGLMLTVEHDAEPRDKTGMKPLTEMSADDRYKGEDGGLYGRGRNVPPDDHRRSAEGELKRIQPLSADGQPAKDGRIVFISISMSMPRKSFRATN